jgi:putative peptidoglycan lipid II flippase
MADRSVPPRPTVGRGGTGAALVAAGILVSRVLGFVRDAVLAHVLGTTATGGALRAALRIPNLLQNLFGEGALSASFIPVYARLRAEGDDEDAVRTAGAVLALLALLSAAITVLGVTFATPLVALLTPGFDAPTRALTTSLVRIMFPGVGLLVLSAWCLGVLNSHRRFFLAYASPALWNVAIIAAVVLGPRDGLEDGARLFAWGALLGSALQVLVQVPAVLGLVRGLRPVVRLDLAPVRTVLRNFGPALASRGAAQVGGFIDLQIATLVSAGAVAALGLGQSITMLPVSLFGMAVSAAELPALSATGGDGTARLTAMRARLEAAQRRIAFFVVPSAAAFLALGDAIAAALYRSGRFGADDARWLWGILAGAAVGLLAGTLARLASSAFFALQDTRTPFRIALVRIVGGLALGWVAALVLPAALGLDPRWGAAGLTLAGGLAGWVEYVLLRRALTVRLGGLPSLGTALLPLWGAAAMAAGAAWGLRALLVPVGAPTRGAACVLLAVFAAVYGASTLLFGVAEARAVLARVARRGGGGR